ncbi:MULTISPECIES: TonB-dependent receptor domain-containing protein [Sphingomonas]|jgi:outer membrane receptor protein involved in Fe transport|nr:MULTISPECIES: TonB-dependent receptor [Sphingomonas]PZT92869.1 MAG: TonB-dependent receptor [Sphingomonas sp.]RSV28986.1 TonB-dependent receptor [Sphingomonas sp. ABOLH]WCP71491.1 TonB-dependent receptor [Sphingomonas hankookensis]
MLTFNRAAARAALLAGAAMLPTIAWAQTAPADPAATQATDGTTTADDEQDVIVVTGTTSRDRPLITASADITLADRADIDRRAPRSTADMLELVPGIFVEATAGQVSNNYSVRGLQGGGQRFVQLQEDGMPILYGGGGADFFFDQDLTIDRLEAVKGGSSGVLTVNGAGATINFISKRPNFREAEGAARVTAYNYGMKRGDFYYSQPLAENLAFNVGGYIQSSPGVRENPFDYAGWRLKGMLEYRFDDGGYARLSAKGGDVENAYYATMPYRLDGGKIRGIPGLDTQDGNVGGDAFANIAVPVSTFAHPSGFREFRYRDGIKAKTAQVRFDIEKPVGETIDLFAHARYLKYSYDFNGLFPGSGTGNAGLTSAQNYLTPGASSPINDLLTLGRAAYPAATRFGIKNLRTGVVLGSNQTAQLAALAGNGFLQRTTLNHDYIDGRDFGANVGGRWEYENDRFKNSLTAGVMYYNVIRKQDQSATASMVNDVKTNSDVYDIVALDGNNQVIGTLSDNGLVSYGDWGAGIRERRDSAVSLYVNDEVAFGDLRVDGGVRWESDDATALDGNQLAVNQPVQPGVGGVIRNVGASFDGTFTTRQRTQRKASWTVGANYLITPNFSVYARYANGFQTNNVDPITTIELYEAGVRYQYGRLFSGSATVFRTNFDNQNYNFANPTNPSQQQNLNADLRTKGVEIDLVVRPTNWFSVDFQGVFQDPQLLNLQLDGVDQGAAFEGNRPERTPAQLFTILPTLTLPDGLGDVYARYKFVGKIFADNGNGIALPSYGVTGIGVNLNLSERVQLNLNADNVFDVVGLTEGNPRQGQTQAITDGYFYARGIVGPTYGGTLTFRF